MSQQNIRILSSLGEDGQLCTHDLDPGHQQEDSGSNQDGRPRDGAAQPRWDGWLARHDPHQYRPQLTEQGLQEGK